MLLPDNIKPENTIYYNGATVLQALQNKKSLDFLELYQNTKSIQNMSFSTYVLCIDWFFLINVAEFKDGKVQICS